MDLHPENSSIILANRGCRGAVAILVLLPTLVTGQIATPAGWGFLPPAILASPGTPADLIFADVNQDGHPDLLVARSDANVIHLFTNDGSGTLISGATFGTANRPSRILMADIDQDGIPDLLVGHSIFGSADLRYLPGTATGGFGAPVVISSPAEVQDMAIGDWDGDGYEDIVIASALGSDIRFFFSSTGYSHGTSVPLGAVPVGLATGDLTGNGIPEVVVSLLDGSLRVLSSDPGVPWSFQFVPALGVGGGALAVADLNDDGLRDVVLVNQAVNSLSIFWNLGAGLLGSGPVLPAGLTPRHVVAVDLDGDGLIDLAVAVGGQNEVGLLANGPPGIFTPAGTLAAGMLPRRLVSRALSPGAPADLLVAAAVSGQIRQFRHASATLATTDPLLPGATVSVVMRCVPAAGLGHVSALALGSTPGMPLPDGRTIPLTPDDLFFFTLETWNPIFQGGIGTLGAGGRAVAQLWVPPWPGLTGLSVVAAFLVLDPNAPFGVGPISPPLQLTVQ